MKKVLSVIISAIAFGLIAGCVIVGVNYLAKEFNVLQPVSVAVEKETPASTENETTKKSSKESNNVVESSESYVYGVANLVDEVMPSVVSITNMQKFIQNGYSLFGFRQQAREYEVPASGSGVIVGMTDDEVIIITNNHVVTDSSSLSVTFNDTETIEAAIKGVDSTKDLAIISVAKSKMKKTTLDGLKVMPLGNSDDLKVGEPVVAIGNALGIGQSVTTGVISAKDRIVEEINSTEKLIQTDAAINPGNSGGALLNLKGELIGINVAKTAGTAIEGVGYAIPANTAQVVIDTLSSKKPRETVPEEEQGYLGITAKNIDTQTAESLDMPEGIYVFRITEDSAAAKSDLKEKDIIVAFDDQNIKTLSELQELLQHVRAGETKKIKVKRLDGGTYVEKEIDVTLGNRPKELQTETEEAKKEDSGSSNQNSGNQLDGYEYYSPFDDFGDMFRQFGFGSMW